MRIASAPGQSRLIQQETIAAVNGPLLPLLRSDGINATFIQLTALSLVSTLAGCTQCSIARMTPEQHIIDVASFSSR